MSRKRRKDQPKPVTPKPAPSQQSLLDAVEPHCDCSSSRMLASMGRSGLRCSEAPWSCPKNVPPACNTGVHDPGSAERRKA